MVFAGTKNLRNVWRLRPGGRSNCPEVGAFFFVRPCLAGGNRAAGRWSFSDVVQRETHDNSFRVRYASAYGMLNTLLSRTQGGLENGR